MAGVCAVYSLYYAVLLLASLISIFAARRLLRYNRNRLNYLIEEYYRWN
jgi:hypothetical protein